MENKLAEQNSFLGRVHRGDFYFDNKLLILLAVPAGLEPATPWFEAKCSIL